MQSVVVITVNYVMKNYQDTFGGLGFLFSRPEAADCGLNACGLAVQVIGCGVSGVVAGSEWAAAVLGSVHLLGPRISWAAGKVKMVAHSGIAA